MALVNFKTWCDKCGSRLSIWEKDKHQCYPVKNHNNESINLKQTHSIHAQKPGDSCRCGGEKSCRYCEGTGRIL